MFLTPDDTHDLCVGRRARALCSRGNGVRNGVLGMECCHCEFFLCESSALICPFSRENWGNHLPPRGSGPAVAEAAKRLRSRRSQMELADESERGIFHLAFVSG